MLLLLYQPETFLIKSAISGPTSIETNFFVKVDVMGEYKNLLNLSTWIRFS